MTSGPSEHSVAYNIGDVTQSLGTLTEGNIRNVRYVRIQWVDLANTIRVRVLPVAYFRKLFQTPTPGITVATCALALVFLQLPEGFSPVGEWVLRLDMASLRACPYAPGHAVVHGFFEEKVPRPLLGGGETMELAACPRTILRRVTKQAKEELGVEFLVGFESEFVLLSATDPPKAINDDGWCIASSISAGTKGQEVLEEIADAIQQAGIELQMYHSEAAPGQYEIITGPLPPLEAADALIHTRQTIFNIATKHGLRATFAPRIYLDTCGTACHTHISPHKRDSPLTSQPPSKSSPYLNVLESTFLAGILAHLPAIQACSLPLPPSYGRMLDGIWSGGTYVAWGIDNRECPVRLSNAHQPRSRNFELKCVDGLANPYISLAAIVGAGVLGIKEGKEVDAKDCSGAKTPAELSDAERREMGIVKRMALSWEEARENLAKDEALKGIMGNEAVELYLAVNKVAGTVYGDGKEREQAKLLVENY
ncbi:glutamine synthetase guanido kinase [Coniophora puteana RWD-64-598 SS2]|uniref:Glutamine synthetase n=1 Tax=Coniophora puteana (strain RWD-64-598) TaxID=741705 RepID=A0A5M3MFQ0_CONPW|nr:glutamine synthetase guanido kinase [Coniophora puteana RWD-64-598 SS2]EIW78078.1 glutamine synthetase guanido kinase [Coniophora puteana RWD-64-598 SS2]